LAPGTEATVELAGECFVGPGTTTTDFRTVGRGFLNFPESSFLETTVDEVALGPEDVDEGVDEVEDAAARASLFAIRF